MTMALRENRRGGEIVCTRRGEFSFFSLVPVDTPVLGKTTWNFFLVFTIVRVLFYEFSPYFGTAEEGNPDQLEEVDATESVKLKERVKTPIKARWLVPLLKVAVTPRPSMSNKAIIEILKPYVIDRFLTQSLLQQTRTSIRTTAFGDPAENIKYLPCLVNSLTSISVLAGEKLVLFCRYVRNY